MDIFIRLLINVLEEGFIFGIMAMGVFISYRILSFPDLSVDGTFPLGACVTALLITGGINPWLACILAFLAGAAAGSITGLLHVRLKITDLLSGILMMTALWTVNLLLTGGTAIRQFFGMDTIFNWGPIALLPDGFRRVRILLMAFLVMIAVKLTLDWFFRTRTGLLLRASGDNGQFVTSLARDQGKMKILGLALGNGCAALAGSVMAQQTQMADINFGRGMVVLSLASVIIGTSIFRRMSFLRVTTMAVLGAIFYRVCLSTAMLIGLPTNYVQLLMAAILTLALVWGRVSAGGGVLRRGI
ncbi:MAG: ABC transporter permease [Oscillospiraceae bacterium]|nr:ABC transporter permease [Oscillospiraceae bacterium]